MPLSEKTIPTPFLKRTSKRDRDREALAEWDQQSGDPDTSEDPLDAQYDGGWPSQWSRDLTNRILPGLWIGGLEGARQATAQRFDLIVNLSGIDVREKQVRYGSGYVAAVPEVTWHIDDGDLPDVETLWRLARMVANVLTTSDTSRVLVHCAAGINRSALLCAAVVMLVRNVNGRTAMATVREGRKGALCNPRFAAWLHGSSTPSLRRRGGKR